MTQVEGFHGKCYLIELFIIFWDAATSMCVHYFNIVHISLNMTLLACERFNFYIYNSYKCRLLTNPADLAL